jgi:hypothetical protein
MQRDPSATGGDYSQPGGFGMVPKAPGAPFPIRSGGFRIFDQTRFLDANRSPRRVRRGAGFRLKTLQGVCMAKSRISATDLIWIFRERMQSFEDCQSGISLAIVPSKEGWSVVMNARGRNDNPRCAKRIEQLQGQLRQAYTLARD